MRFEELHVGLAAERTREVTDDVIRRYAELTEDFNPLHMDEAVAARSRFGTRIAHGMLTAGFISAVIGMDLPGPGTLYVGQTIRFLRPVKLGDTITTRVEVTELFPEKRRAKLSTVCRNQSGDVVLDGEATIMMLQDSETA
jgi:3-hydroxybutyryl-CoA dehydratase